MNLRVVGCSHRSAPIAARERLAFSREQTSAALAEFRRQFADVELVLLSTCNRVELYTATETGAGPRHDEVARFLARFHALDLAEVGGMLYERSDEDALRHLFTVASSLDSMVVGEPQILAQVKRAYEQAVELGTAGPVTHLAFQAALKAARRVAGETAIHRNRVSVPSVAVADFAQQIFERFDDKEILVIGAGEMAEETLQYLRAEGGHRVTVVNRSPDRASELAERWQGRAVAWENLPDALADADLIVSTTGAKEPVVRLDDFVAVEPRRYGRPLFVLDLAVPRDFDPAVGERPGVYLYSIDDLQDACRQNRVRRDKELPVAMRIVAEETGRFMADFHHRATAPVILRLREDWQKPKEEELRRLLNKLPELDAHAEDEVRQAFDRLVNKLLHPPLESLRNESRHGIPNALAEALSKLFQLKD